MGGGKDSQNLDILQGISQKAFNIGEPSMQAAMDMLHSAITTGGVESRQPVYSQAVEKSMQATSQAQQAMADDFARTGIAGTPFASQIMGSMQQQGAQQANMIPTQMENEDYWKVLSLFFPGAGQSMGMGVQGMGQAASVEAQRMNAMMQMMSSLYGSTAGAASSAWQTPSSVFNIS